MPMATKLGRMVTYLHKFLPIKSHDLLFMWSSKITTQTKIIISPLPQCLWPRNLARWSFILMGSFLQNHMTLWLHGPVRSHGKLKTLYLHYHSVYGHQTCQDGNLPWLTPAYKVTSPFDYGVLQNYMTN